MIQPIEVHSNIYLKCIFIFLFFISSCSIKKSESVDDFCVPTNLEIKEFEGMMYVEEIFLRDTLNFGNYGTDSFYRSSPILLKEISLDLENDYKNGSFVLYRSDSIMKKIKKEKIEYQDERLLHTIIDSLCKKSIEVKARDEKLIKRFKKKKSAFKYKQIHLKITYIFSGCHSVWLPNFKKNDTKLIRQVKVPIYTILEIK